MSAVPGGFAGTRAAGKRLAPEVNRILSVRNLPFKVTAEQIYEIFGKYGAVRQVRLGCERETKGRAFVVYEDIHDAKNACEHLSGYSVGNRYLIVTYHQPAKAQKAQDARKKEMEVEALRKMAEEVEGR
uniref:RRM domain-containing protein n=1 Tax=Prasinoderma coloniale TaxID=156133 RepID=A0A7R9Y4M7_9VIRI|eukprot:PRCOL_00006242-RA